MLFPGGEKATVKVLFLSSALCILHLCLAYDRNSIKLLNKEIQNNQKCLMEYIFPDMSLFTYFHVLYVCMSHSYKIALYRQTFMIVFILHHKVICRRQYIPNKAFIFNA